MKALLDTNIFLEIILDQKKSDEAQQLISSIDCNEFYISDFSLHSIGLYLYRKNKSSIYNKFIFDIIENAGLKIARLAPHDLKKIHNTFKKYNLDFDDAYQYIAAKTYDLQIISFDSDFDNTKKGRKTPLEVLLD